MRLTLTLKKNYEMQRVLKKGTWHGGNLINVYISKNNKTFNYMGVAVGKKVSKSSVRRNRIRRLIKESYRLEEEKLKKGYNLVIVWKTSSPFEAASFKDIRADVNKCLKKADMFISDEYKSNEEDKDV